MRSSCYLGRHLRAGALVGSRGASRSGGKICQSQRCRWIILTVAPVPLRVGFSHEKPEFLHSYGHVVRSRKNAPTRTFRGCIMTHSNFRMAPVFS
jgi:hypothetical protein